MTGEPGMGVLHDALHHRWVEHAELRGKSLHHTSNRSTFGTGGGHHLQRDRPTRPGQSGIRCPPDTANDPS
jgi:hypothetical protein